MVFSYKEIAEHITSIATNSKEIVDGSAFIAIKGINFDGHLFINDAINKGARFIFVEDSTYIVPEKKLSFIKVNNTRMALAKLSSLFYKKKPDNIVAITGTNGKTSVSYFFQQIINILGKKSTSIGTLGVKPDLSNMNLISNLTTPDTLTMHKLLAICADEEINYVSIEASSHGLDQHRLDYIKFRAAAFTNFTHDHLDYHKNMDDYLSAKIRLFTEILEDSFVVLNTDIPEFIKLFNLCKERNHTVLCYGKNIVNCTKQVVIKNIKYINLSTQNVIIEFDSKEYEFSCSLIGDFQIYNILCAMLLVLSLGFKFEDILLTIPKLLPPPGRVEIVNTKDKNKLFIVDYAHTPDALEKILQELVKIKQTNQQTNQQTGKLLLVFGCGGNRDNDKRSQMGKIAYNYADIVIITDDNPRFEDPQLIRQEIISSCPNALEIADRKEAIHYAYQLMENGDILIVAGKGHEKYQIIGKNILEFDDVKIIRDL